MGARAGHKGPQKRKAAPGRKRTLSPSGLTAADVMVRKVFTVRPGTAVEEVSELFQMHNIHCAPVVGEDGALTGMLTEDDLVFGQMGLSDSELRSRDSMESARGAVSQPAQEVERVARRVDEIMTASPISVPEETPLEDLCRLMWRLKIHRLPVVREGKLRGIISTIDICRLVAQGRARIARPGDLPEMS